MLDVFRITGPAFLVIAIGFLAVRSGLFDKSETRILGKFAINIALPAMLLKALTERPFAEIMNVGYLTAYTLGSLAAFATGLAFARLVQKKVLPASVVHGMGMSLSNSGFIGYPIVLQVVGPAAGIALALCFLVENLLIVPLALALAESSGGNGGKIHQVVLGTFARLARNPLIIAIVAGFSLALLGIGLPVPVARSIDMLSLAAAGVALFVIGGTLVGIKVRGMRRDIAQIVAGKLVFHPLFVFIALALVPPLDPTLRVAAIAFACMPMASIFPIIAQRFGQEELPAAALMAATISAFFSVSAVIWMLQPQLG
ncbi:AEC family transporter [Aromatoleum toluvorans]|uniref:AEC family transporter n=1 Tax=Aromatoleum toluvorans TaxID=92002 RepID=A0ABX1Q0I1_9RHOO|nr:AEC family transporter [Aromatoleum toluvorans]NMG44437.1 AEC family transporter [Aromatoleum toluvorans]